MNFVEAVKFLKENGGYITCISGEIIMYSHSEYKLYEVLNDNKFEPYEITISDILRSDWEIYKEEPKEPAKLYTFDEALIALKNGKKIRRQSSISEYHLDKASSRILEIYDGELRNGEAWWAEAFSDEGVLANDWVILDN